MGADRAVRRGGAGLLGAVAAIAACAVAAPAARSQSLYGYAQVQYQRYQDRLRVVALDGTLRELERVRESWLQTYDLNHQTSLAPNLLLTSNLRLTDLSYNGLPDATRTPQGSLRLTHPVFSFYGVHRPTSTTGAFGRGGFGGFADTTRQVFLTTHTQETSFNAALSPARLPRLDLAWARRHRNADLLGSEETAIQRSARTSWQRGPLSLYGGLADLTRGAGGTLPGDAFQRTANAGAALHATPHRTLAATLGYDVSGTRTGLPGRGDQRTTSHSANSGLDWHPSRALTGTAQWLYHRSAFRNGVDQSLDDHDGSGYLNWMPARLVRLTGGGGLRTTRAFGREELLRYATAIAALEGWVRPGWYSTLNASHTSNWDPLRGDYGVQSYRAATRLRVAKGIDLDGALGATANGDTATRDQRYATEALGHARLQPLSGIALSWSDRLYRVGRSLGRASGRSRSTTVDARWKPVATLEILGVYTRTGTLGSQGPKLSTRSASVRWAPVAAWQITGTWSKSDEQRADPLADLLSGREIASARLLAALTRSLTFNGGATVANPGTSEERRQIDAGLTLAFGRR